jgi:LysM repeat protein
MGSSHEGNHFNSVSGSLNYQEGQGISASASYTTQNVGAKKNMEAKRAAMIADAREEFGLPSSIPDDKVLEALSLNAKLKGQNNNSLTNQISRFLIGEVGGGLATIFGGGGDAHGYMEGGEYKVRTCFVAGTLVTIVKKEYRSKILSSGDSMQPNPLLEEKVPIETVKVGDVVKSANEHTGKISYKRVINTYMRIAPRIYEIKYDNGQSLETTGDHPFYIQNQGWKKVSDIRLGENQATYLGLEKNKKIYSTNDFTHQIKEISFKENKTTVYNFEVEDDHTYFVTISELWVHNADDYMVKKGENLKSIAKKINEKYGTNFTVEELAIANDIKNPNKIKPGQGINLSREMAMRMTDEQKEKYLKDNPDDATFTSLHITFDGGIITKGKEFDIGKYNSYVAKGYIYKNEIGFFENWGDTRLLGVGKSANSSLSHLGAGINGLTVKATKEEWWGDKTYYTEEGGSPFGGGGVVKDKAGRIVGYSVNPALGNLPLSTNPFAMKVTGNDGKGKYGLSSITEKFNRFGIKPKPDTEYTITKGRAKKTPLYIPFDKTKKQNQTIETLEDRRKIPPTPCYTIGCENWTENFWRNW